ncbi:MAG: hypothetical protein AB8H12_08710 [Lewinella sp.]
MRILILLIISISTPLALTAQKGDFPFEPVNWSTVDSSSTFLTHLGVPAMKITGPDEAVARNLNFSTGTIEFDYQATDLGFCGINFRRTAKDKEPLATDYSEFVYLRNFDPEGKVQEGGIQYAPHLRATNLWDVLFPYQAGAAIKQEGWNHLKLVVSKQQMKVYLNEEEVLWIPELLGRDVAGGLSLSGNGIYANLVISPNETEGLPDDKGADLTNNDLRYLRKWQRSQEVLLSKGQNITSADIPDSTESWTAIATERFGLVNLIRHASSPFTEGNRKVVWLKTTVYSDTDQFKQLDLGYSDDVWVFVNGYPAYVGQNTYGYPIQKQPSGRLSLENSRIQLPFQKGKTELLIAVASDFFGWGIIARFTNAYGIRF